MGSRHWLRPDLQSQVPGQVPASGESWGKGQRGRRVRSLGWMVQGHRDLQGGHDCWSGGSFSACHCQPALLQHSLGTGQVAGTHFSAVSSCLIACLPVVMLMTGSEDFQFGLART